MSTRWIVFIALVSIAGFRVQSVDGHAMWFTAHFADKIQQSDMNGQNLIDVATSPLGGALGIDGDWAAGKVYWSSLDADPYDDIEGWIFRADLDGNNMEQLVTFGDGTDRASRIAVDSNGGKMYWTSGQTDKIQRANLDGSNIEDVLTAAQGIDRPYDLELDVSAGKLYWTELDLGTIYRANLDGTNVEDLVTGVVNPTHLGLDPINDKMYWIESGKLGLGGVRKIQRANFDGTDVEDLWVSNPDGRCPSKIEVDPYGQKMYWLEGNDDMIMRSDLDGSNMETVVDFNDDCMRSGLALQTAAPGDFNYDGNVDMADVDMLWAVRDTDSPPTDAMYDLAGGGHIDLGDATELIEGIIGTNMADTNLDGVVDILDLGNLADRYGQAGDFGDGDTNFDGVIGIMDLGNLADVYGQTFGSPAPEPASLALLALGGLTVLRRRSPRRVARGDRRR